MNELRVLTKAEARAQAYAALHAAKAARFPFPIEGRIPNFVGAEAAVQKVAGAPGVQSRPGVKVNPDSAAAARAGHGAQGRKDVVHAFAQTERWLFAHHAEGSAARRRTASRQFVPLREIR